MATQVKTKAAKLYEADFYLWALAQAEALRAGRLEDLDLEHLAEEVEGLAAATKGAVRSRTRTIMEHLLKLEYSPAVEPRRGWRATVRRTRQDLEDDLTGSLRNLLAEELHGLYKRVRRDLAETMRDYGEGAAAAKLPEACPYTLDQILGDWLPAEESKS